MTAKGQESAGSWEDYVNSINPQKPEAPPQTQSESWPKTINNSLDSGFVELLKTLDEGDVVKDPRKKTEDLFNEVLIEFATTPGVMFEVENILAEVELVQEPVAEKEQKELVFYEGIINDLKKVVDTKTRPDERQECVERLLSHGIDIDGFINEPSNENDREERRRMLQYAIPTLNGAYDKRTNRWVSKEAALDFLREEFGISLDADFEDTEEESTNNQAEIRRERATANEVIKGDEKGYSKTFLKDKVDDHYDQIYSAKLLATNEDFDARVIEWEIKINRGGEDAEKAKQEMFAAAQKMYLETIIGRDNLNRIDTTRVRLSIQKSRGLQIDKDLTNLQTNIVKMGVDIQMQRGWINSQGEQLTNFLTKKYVETVEKPKTFKEAVQHCYTELEKLYGTGQNMLNPQSMALFESDLTRAISELEKYGEDGRKGAEVMEKEARTIGLLHDLKNLVDSKTAVDENMLKYAAALDGQQITDLIHLRNRLKNGEPGGNDFVARYLFAINEEARKIYHTGQSNDPNRKYFVLEDKEMEKELLAKIGGDKVFFQIARDLYRVTGGEARYGVAGNPHIDRDGKLVYDSNGSIPNGGFLRTALNMRKSLASSSRRPELWAHLDTGVSSFWETIWKDAAKSDPTHFWTENEIGTRYDRNAGIPPRKYAVLTLDALRRVDITKKDNEISLNTWLANVGKVALTMNKELQFMGYPTIKNVISVLGGEYFPVIKKPREGRSEPIGREEYLVERLGDVVEFLKTDPDRRPSPSQLRTAIEDVRTSSGIFRSDEEFNAFMKKHGIPMNEFDANIRDVKNVASAMSGEQGSKRQNTAVRTATSSLAKGILKGILPKF